MKPGLEIAEAEACVVRANDDGVLVALRWRSTDDDQFHRQYQTLKLRDGLVFDMQDHRDERGARRALRMTS